MEENLNIIEDIEDCLNNIVKLSMVKEKLNNVEEMKINLRYIRKIIIDFETMKNTRLDKLKSSLIDIIEDALNDEEYKEWIDNYEKEKNTPWEERIKDEFDCSIPYI